MATASSPATPYIVITILTLSILSRLRRNIGRKPLKPARLIIPMAIYGLMSMGLGVMGVIVGMMADASLLVVGGQIGGMAVGMGLGLLGLHLTQIETTPEGKFYTPNKYLGAAVSILFTVRVVYRLLTGTTTAADDGTPHLDAPQMALTLFMFGMLAAYYLTLFGGTLYRGRDRVAA